MRKRLLVSLVVVVVSGWPALPVRARQVSANTAAGITFTGEKVSLGLGGSYPLAKQPASLDGGWSDPTWWVGVSRPRLGGQQMRDQAEAGYAGAGG